MSQQIYDYYAIVPHVSKPMVCLLFADDRWWLPHWAARERHAWQAVEHVNAGMHEHFGLEVTTLRCFKTDLNAVTGHVDRIYEFENRSPAWSPPGRGRWVARDALDVLPMGDPVQRALLIAWFDEIQHGIPARRRPWARRGWLDATRNWIRDQLRMEGITLHSVEQVRTWERSCLLRARSNAGNFYLKALPPMFAAEIALTRALAAWYPRNFPEIVAVEPDRRWLLLRDFGGQPLDTVPNLVAWETAIRRLAEIQIGLALRQSELAALGVPVRTLDDLPAHLALLLDDAHLPKIGGITGDEIVRLRTLLPAITAQRDELVALGIPLSLDHGDLWASNIIWAEGATPLYFDWSDAAVTHSFFSLGLFLDDASQVFGADPAAAARLREAYLAPWALYKSLDDLQRALTLALFLGPLHQAVTYHRAILPKMEQPWEMERMLTFFLKMALDRRDAPPPMPTSPPPVPPPSLAPTRMLPPMPGRGKPVDPLATSIMPAVPHEGQKRDDPDGGQAR